MVIHPARHRPRRWVLVAPHRPDPLAGHCPRVADVLARAAAVAADAARGPVLSVDVFDALLTAVGDLAPGLPAHRRRELADIARERLAGYLVMVGEAEPGVRTGVAVHGWVLGLAAEELAAAFLAAARFWRHHLDHLDLPATGRLTAHPLVPVTL